jgi:hypothetical protein
VLSLRAPFRVAARKALSSILQSGKSSARELYSSSEAPGKEETFLLPAVEPKQTQAHKPDRIEGGEARYKRNGRKPGEPQSSSPPSQPGKNATWSHFRSRSAHARATASK